jgi:hypothetical protein
MAGSGSVARIETSSAKVARVEKLTFCPGNWIQIRIVNSVWIVEEKQKHYVRSLTQPTR